MKNKKNLIYGIAFFLIIATAIIVRFVKLDKIPSGLYYDEIDLGYQVRSLLSTGKDYRNTLSPFYFKSFNTDKTPLPIYFSALFTPFFDSPEYQVRAGAAIAGVICVFLAMIISYQLTNKKLISFAAGLVFALSPWQIQFSRMAFEAIFMLMIFMATMTVFLEWTKKKQDKLFYLSAVLLGLNVYTYRTMSLFVPLTTIVLLLIYFKDFWKTGIIKSIIWLSIIGVLYMPFIYATTIASADQTRIGQISIFSDTKVPVFVMRNREIDSADFQNPEIGKSPVWWSKIFHNKAVSFLTSFSYNYYRNFSSEFLFLSGDPNLRHSPKDTGELIFLDAIGLLTGLWFVSKNIKNKNFLLLLGLLLLSPIPSDLTMDGGNHASRLMTLAFPLLIVVSIGYGNIVEWLLHIRRGKPVLAVLMIVWVCAEIFYLQKYFVHFPIESARDFGYGYKQAILGINKHSPEFKEIRLTGLNDPPMLYYFYWSNTSPEMVQKYGTKYEEDTIKGLPLDHIKPISWKDKICTFDEILKLRADTIYMAAYNNIPLDFRYTDRDKVPNGIKLLEVIKYPDNEVAYYLLTRDTKNGNPVLPDKLTSCK